MSTISSTGVGSGLDVNSLVTQLVAAERAPEDKRITSANAKLTTEVSALAQLKSSMATVQTAVGTMTTSAQFDVRKVTVGDPAYFSATATGSAASGRYEIEVEQLAKAAQLGSAPFAAGQTAAVGTGRLSISVGGRSFDADIADSSKTLAGIRDAINKAPGNTGVQATIIRDVLGARLVLSGSKTGAANAIKVAATGGDGGLQQLAYDASGTKNLSAISPAQDAIIKASNFEIHSTTNSVSDAIDGVTLNLTKAETGTVVTLDVSRDTDTITSKVKNFVTAFNTLAATMKTLGAYDATTKTAGPLLGDSLLRGLDSQVRRLISDPVAGLTGPYTTLSSLGITTSADGTLALDESKLGTAIASDPASVGKVFAAADSGAAVRLNRYFMDSLASTGQMAVRNKDATDKKIALTTQQSALDARMTVIQGRYMKQFTALDTMLSQMNTTSSYLTQQIQGLQNLNKA